VTLPAVDWVIVSAFLAFQVLIALWSAARASTGLGQ